MRKQDISARVSFLLACCTLFGMLAYAPVTQSQGAVIPEANDFELIADGGFGDFQNSTNWSMYWWEDQLYVGTARALTCWTVLAIHLLFPSIPYPPEDPDLVCLDPITDMDLAAEIWRWNADEGWDLVHESPGGVPVPGSSATTARDVGYRYMELFTESDGTEALYVSTTYPKAVNPDGYPPPRIVRTTDGETWEGIPQEPGTIMGDYDQASFRAIEAFNDKFMVVAATIEGGGPLWEAEEPQLGNDAFTVATPAGLDIFSMEVYNDQLYVGTSNAINPNDAPDVTGYEVLRTDGAGTPPYTFESVVPPGGYSNADPPPRVVVSMTQYDGRLYAGTNFPVEIVRVNPDDSWDLIIGDSRVGPTGLISPLGNYGSGFDWNYNIHAWRMIEHDGLLFVGTADSATDVRSDPALVGLEEFIGGDLYVSDDGVTFYPITLNGFGDLFNMGFRTFASTPEGLFVGTSNSWFGAEVWHLPNQVVNQTFIPLAISGGANRAQPTVEAAPDSPVRRAARHPLLANRAARLMVETTAQGNLLSWEPPAPGTAASIYRVTMPAEGHATHAQIGRTNDAIYLDQDVQAGTTYRYYVVADRDDGTPAGASNLVTVPLARSPITLEEVVSTLDAWSSSEISSDTFVPLQQMVAHGEISQATVTLQQIRTQLLASTSLPEWRQRDVDLLFTQFGRRLWLAERQLIPSGILIPAPVPAER